jgi:hypothetical protein
VDDLRDLRKLAADREESGIAAVLRELVAAALTKWRKK